MQKMIKLINYKNIKNHRIFLFGIFIFYLFIVGVNGCEPVARESQSKELIEKYYPDYILTGVEELDSFTKDCYKEHYLNITPSLINKDFDGNGLLDFAFLLRNKKSKNAKTIFTIFLQSKKNQFKLTYYLNLDIYRDDVYIIPIEPGKLVSQTNSIDAPMKEVRLNNAAVELVYCGKASVAFYWDDKKNDFDTITTSD